MIYGNPYDINPLDWLRAELRILYPDDKIFEQQTHSFWCSALIAYIYIKMNFLPSNIPWTLITPAEWGASTTKSLPFKNCILSEVEEIYLN